MIRKTKDENNKEVLTPEQESNLIDNDALLLDTIRTLYKYIDEKDKKVYFYLSSNYQDLYVLMEGDILLKLPKKVDFHTNMNILNRKRPYLKRTFTISIEIGSKTGNTDIKFVERWFDDLHKSYIVLMEDCGYYYATKETKNFCFELDYEGEVNKKIKPLP